MSKIGKRPVAIPSGVTAAVEGQRVKMKGPKGELSFVLTDEVGAKLDKGAITVERRGDSKRHRAIWGMSPAVSTATTPGRARASVRSTETMRACGNGLRTNAACSMPGRRTSSM